MAVKSFPLSKVYGLLETGPVVMVTTAHGGRPNIMTMSWYSMIEFEPPLVGCVISNRNHSFGLLKAAKECVINIPTVEIAEKVVGCGNTSGANIDKFRRFRLTPKPATLVDAPLIEECLDVLPLGLPDHQQLGNSKKIELGGDDRKTFFPKHPPQYPPVRKAAQTFGDVAINFVIPMKQYSPKPRPDF